MANRIQGEDGFSLVEVLVAVAIAAVAIITLYRAVLQSSTATSAMSSRFAATVLARSLLDDAVQSPITGKSAQTGREGALNWELTTESPSPMLATLVPRGLALYDVKVRVNWPPHGTLELSTLVLGH